MDPHLSTTPFGRRPLSLAMVASQVVAKARPPKTTVHKWQIFRAICEGKAAIGVSDRGLAVLNALLTFHPETALTGEDDSSSSRRTTSSLCVLTACRRRRSGVIWRPWLIAGW